MVEGKADSVMCAYKSINGQPACVNEFLLDDQLRGKWGLQGYVVSDCDAVTDIFNGHRFTARHSEASALALKRGMDKECAVNPRAGACITRCGWRSGASGSH